jgi:indole-3-acetate monooxygenase
VTTGLRDAMRNFATGVCIASTYRDGPGGRAHDAITINSLTSVSLDPPLVSMSLRNGSSFLADLLSSKVWSVSILDSSADDVARVFSRDRATRRALIDTLAVSVGDRTGTLIVDSPSSMECRLCQFIEAGDHTVVIGEAVRVDVSQRRPPLVFLHGKFHSSFLDREPSGSADHHAAHEGTSMTSTEIRTPEVLLDQDGPATAEDILARAKAAVPVLRARSEEIEKSRRLPADIVELLRSTGVFRMAVAKERGGPELTSAQQTEVIETLAYGDTAAGWCAMIGMDTPLYSAFLSENAVSEMFPHPDMITAGLIFPSGRAERVPGGYRLTGRWQFGSGITHADWVSAGGFVTSGGELETGPDGQPVWRLMLVRPSEVTVFDTWHTTGLRGSGSLDYEITDVFVPEEHSFSFATALSRTGPLAAPDAFVRNMPGVPLGLARAALDYVRDHAVNRVNRQTGEPWSDNYRVQITIAEAEMEFVTARHAVYGSLHKQWDLLAQGKTLDDLTPDERVSTLLPRVNSFRAARRIVNKLYDLLATTSIYEPSPMDRWLRDATTMCQHIVAQDQVVQSAGAYLVGGTPQFPFSLGIVD